MNFHPILRLFSTFRGKLFLLLGFILLTAQPAWASGANAELTGVLLGLVIVLLAAKIGGDLAIRMKQPEVLGELVIGVILGNVVLLGLTCFESLKHQEALTILSELGVILLLFEVGLETSVGEMLKVGWSSLLVAILGIIAPFGLGWVVSYIFLPDAHALVHIFIGATLCATSVGITARVLKDLGKIQTGESKIILGAAVIDDVLGLLVLAIVTGIIEATNAGGTLAPSAIVMKMVLAFGFLFGAIAIGTFVTPFMFRIATQMRSHGLLLSVSLATCFGLSYVASLVELAPIVGAFTAGLILQPVHYKDLASRNNDAEIDELIAPITALLVPIFFVTMGMRVSIADFSDLNVLHMAFWLTLVAIIGKQVCSFGVLDKSKDKFLIGLGMIPRGEVGLIFAGIGYSLKINGEQIIDTATFGAVVFMVIVTTMVTPPAIKWRFNSPRHKAPEPPKHDKKEKAVQQDLSVQ